MSQPSVLIVRTAGTNCDEETRFAFERVGACVEAVHIRKLRTDPAQLERFQVIAFPGGFSYGDDLGSGVVLAHEIAQTLSEPLHRFVEKGGLIIGICNGFQVLVKTGLLPACRLENIAPLIRREIQATLTFNDSQRFEDRWVELQVESDLSPFLKGAKGRRVLFPIAHAEGKFITRDADVLDRLATDGQIAFRYVTRNGEPAIAYPENPNGSISSIAGITDPTGRILGLMPHPERHILGYQHPRWTREGLKETGDGMFIFENAIVHAAQAVSC